MGKAAVRSHAEFHSKTHAESNDDDDGDNCLVCGAGCCDADHEECDGECTIQRVGDACCDKKFPSWAVLLLALGLTWLCCCLGGLCLWMFWKKTRDRRVIHQTKIPYEGTAGPTMVGPTFPPPMVQMPMSTMPMSASVPMSPVSNGFGPVYPASTAFQ
eukprot:gene8684-1555_t